MPDAAARRATVVMPPGTGKTLVGLWALEAEARDGRVGVVVLPTRPLIDQTLSAYRKFSSAIASGRIHVLVVASDCADASVERTTRADAIREFLVQHADAPVLVLSTYDSLHNVSAAVEAGASDRGARGGGDAAGSPIGLVVFDEAHYMAGRGQKYSFGLDDAKLRARRRLFLTGTPRIFTAHRGIDRSRGATSAGGGGGGIGGGGGDGGNASSVRSMDDVSRFGPIVYRLPFAQAVEDGLVVPLQLLVMNVSDAYARLCARLPALAVAVADESIAQEVAELAVAIASAMRDHRVSKAFSFHRTVKETRAFARAAQTLQPHLFPDGDGAEVQAVWGALGSERIEAVLARARESRRSIVANPKVLATGIDAPAVDLVVLAKPSESYVAVRQMVGRASRPSAGKREGCVLLPLRTTVADAGASAEGGVAGGSSGAAGGSDVADGSFGTAINVLKAMLEHDEALQQRLSAGLVELGRIGTRVNATAVLGGGGVTAVGVPLEVLQQQLGSALLRLGDPWDVWLGRLQAYVEEHGDCLVPYSHVTADGFNLGSWVSTQRQAYKGSKGGLSAEQVSRLEALGMVWDPLSAAWEEGFRRLQAYAEERGDCLVPQRHVTADGFNLGTWLRTQRNAYKGSRGGPSAEQVSRLEALGMVWSVGKPSRARTTEETE